MDAVDQFPDDLVDDQFFLGRRGGLHVEGFLVFRDGDGIDGGPAAAQVVDGFVLGDVVEPGREGVLRVVALDVHERLLKAALADVLGILGHGDVFQDVGHQRAAVFLQQLGEGPLVAFQRQFHEGVVFHADLSGLLSSFCHSCIR